MDALENLIFEMFQTYGPMSDERLFERVVEDFPATQPEVVGARQEMVASGLVVRRHDWHARDRAGFPVSVWGLIEDRAA